MWVQLFWFLIQTQVRETWKFTAINKVTVTTFLRLEYQKQEKEFSYRAKILMNHGGEMKMINVKVQLGVMGEIIPLIFILKLLHLHPVVHAFMFSISILISVYHMYFSLLKKARKILRRVCFCKGRFVGV